MQTGENLAWSFPTPFRHHPSTLIRCPGFSLASKMSGCTTRGGQAARRAPCSPMGRHTSWFDSTFMVGAESALGGLVAAAPGSLCVMCIEFIGV